jgi:KipI family sensor histidine kinase inhibitor
VAAPLTRRDAVSVRSEARHVSESSLLLEFPDAAGADANHAAIAVAAWMRREPLRGVLDLIPGARTLFVVFDPEVVGRRTLVRRLRRASAAAVRIAAARESRLFRLPVSYGGDAGVDLVPLARDLGIAPEELARRHSGAEYSVSFLGFSPGFAYLTGLPAELRAPRRDTPRPRVPGGSVGIGGEYTAVYPSESPAGWRLIGRSPARLFAPWDDPPALLAPGDRVRFDPIGEAELMRRLARSSEQESDSAAAGGGAIDATDATDIVFEVIAPGLWTSVQGAPRHGLGSSGVPAGGAMDPEALDLGNAALGNPRDAAALEMTLSGPTIAVRRDSVVSIAGADLDARCNGKPVDLESPVAVEEGDVLAFGHAKHGARAYLCVRGGLAERGRAEPVRRLAKGDLVRAARGGGEPGGVARRAGARPRREEGEEPALRVLPGPQAAAFPAAAARIFFSSAYRVSSESDRRGIRLDGPAIPLAGPADVPPEGTALGAIQVPSSGLPIVLGPDRPVTGGYVKIGTLAAGDWPLLAQALPGGAVRFRSVGFAEILGEVD